MRICICIYMIRHLKRDIAVPPPIRSTVLLECSAAERLAYNSLVSFLRANLVLTAMSGASEGAGKSSRVESTGLVWSGLDWSGLVWSGLDWSGLVWSGLVWSGLVWSGSQVESSQIESNRVKSKQLQQTQENFRAKWNPSFEASGVHSSPFESRLLT